MAERGDVASLRIHVNDTLGGAWVDAAHAASADINLESTMQVVGRKGADDLPSRGVRLVSGCSGCVGWRGMRGERETRMSTVRCDSGTTKKFEGIMVGSETGIWCKVFRMLWYCRVREIIVCLDGYICGC